MVPDPVCHAEVAGSSPWPRLTQLDQRGTFERHRPPPLAWPGHSRRPSSALPIEWKIGDTFHPHGLLISKSTGGAGRRGSDLLGRLPGREVTPCSKVFRRPPVSRAPILHRPSRMRPARSSVEGFAHDCRSAPCDACRGQSDGGLRLPARVLLHLATALSVSRSFLSASNLLPRPRSPCGAGVRP